MSYQPLAGDPTPNSLIRQAGHHRLINGFQRGDKGDALGAVAEEHLWIAKLLSAFYGPASRLWPVYVLTSLAICFAIYRFMRVRTGFWAWVFPKSVYFHSSTRVDVKVFILNRILSGFGFLGTVSIRAGAAAWVNAWIGGSNQPDSTWPPIALTLALILISDFVTYWVHRTHHTSRVLWPLHALHHSAEVLTPLTAYRAHPAYSLISTLAHGSVIGASQGVLLGLFVGHIDTVTIAGVNAFVMAFNLAGANLRHSHIWLSYGRVLEHILISPAQHQIHHSVAPRHHNKNYGEIFALWDWMFNTLYIPEHREELEFGLSNGGSRRVENRHTSLTSALLVPLRDSWHQLRKPPKDGPRTAAGLTGRIRRQRRRS